MPHLIALEARNRHFPRLTSNRPEVPAIDLLASLGSSSFVAIKPRRQRVHVEVRLYDLLFDCPRE